MNLFSVQIPKSEQLTKKTKWLQKQLIVSLMRRENLQIKHTLRLPATQPAKKKHNKLSICPGWCCCVLQEKTKEYSWLWTWENKSLSPFSPCVLSILWDFTTKGGSNITAKQSLCSITHRAQGRGSISQTLQDTSLLGPCHCLTVETSGCVLHAAD